MIHGRVPRRAFAVVPPVLLLCGFAVWCLSPTATAGETTYWGSERCADCHQAIYNDFRQSGHPYKLVDAAAARVRPIPLPDGYTWDDVSYVIGGFKWKSRYIDTDGYIITNHRVDTDGDGDPDMAVDGRNQWNYETLRWVDYHAGEVEKPYDCGSCHTTGWVADEDWDFDEDLSDNQDGLPGMHGTFAFGGIQCEECHGPRAQGPEGTGDHGFIDDSAAACGSCHIRGSSDTIPASGGFIRHHEQYNEQLASPHAGLDCVTCHDPHKQSGTSVRVTCVECHETVAASYAGTPMDKWGVSCEDCHMAKATKSADSPSPYRGDVMTHLFTIDTDANGRMFTEDGKFVALDGQGKASVTLDFACLSCHRAETMEWAELYAENFHGASAGVAEVLPGIQRRRIRFGIFH